MTRNTIGETTPPMRSDRKPGMKIAGFTMMEVIVALAIFLVVMVATAQGLVSSFNGIKMQEERTAAMNACRSVMSTLRQIAIFQPTSDACPEDTILFPCAVLNWVDNFPATIEDIDTDPDAMEIYGGFFSLPEQQFIIQLTDAAGNAVSSNPTTMNMNTNPVYVSVTTTWRGFKGQTLRFELRSIITNR